MNAHGTVSGGTSTPTARALDPSVSMLRAIVDTALDPDYARLSHSTERAPRGRSRKAGIGAVITFAVAGLVLGIAVVDVRTTVVPEARQARDVLADRVRDRVALTDAAEADVAELRAQIATLTEQQADSGDGAERKALELGAASTAVQGPGVTVTVADAPSVGTKTASADDLGRVLDRDLQQVVNGLWAAGAEAVSINDQRLTSTSAIRSAGQAILVDYRPLAPPYTVRAIGDPANLNSGFVEGPSGLALRTLADAYGIRFDVNESDDLNLPAGSATVLRVARPVLPKESAP